MKQGFVYIITNHNNSTLYIGVTHNLAKRVYQHRNKIINNSFSDKYNLCKLVYYEQASDIQVAIQREKQIKNRHRERKNNLISEFNPKRKDLYDDIMQ